MAILDGDDADGEVHTFCGRQPLHFLSQHDVLHVRFHSDVSNEDVGFRIHYEQIVPGESIGSIYWCAHALPLFSFVAT